MDYSESDQNELVVEKIEDSDTSEFAGLPEVREFTFCPLPPFYFRRYMSRYEAERRVLTVSTRDGREVRTLRAF